MPLRCSENVIVVPLSRSSLKPKPIHIAFEQGRYFEVNKIVPDMKKPTRYTVWYRIGLPQKGEDMASQEKYTILYARLSQEDLQKKNGKEDDSNFILYQRLYLEKYAADHGFSYTKFISDDGYTGTNFNRPGWQEVMELVESDQVATIIVKDEYRDIGLIDEMPETMTAETEKPTQTEVA